MEKVLMVLAAGAVSIGVITALFLPGRQTIGGIKAGGTALSGVFGTVIKG